MGAPFQNAPPMKIEIAPPAPGHVGRVVRPPWSRPQPPLPIDDILGGLGFGGQPIVVGGRRQGVGMDGVQFSEPPALREIDRMHEIANIATLSASLIDPAIVANPIRERSTLGNGHRAGFFAVDVLARLGCQNRGEGMPAVSGGDHNGIDVIASEEFKHVAIGRAVAAAMLLIDDFFGGFAPLAADIAHGHKLGFWLLQEYSQIVCSATAAAENPHHDPLARSDRPVEPQC